MTYAQLQDVHFVYIVEAHMAQQLVDEDIRRAKAEAAKPGRS